MGEESQGMLYTGLPVQLAGDEVEAGGELGDADHPEREPAVGEREDHREESLHQVRTNVETKVYRLRIN